MVQPYKIGHCPSCGTNIMVRDTNRQWTSMKPNFRQVDLKFADGPPVRTIMCSNCYENGFNKSDLLATITHENSQACTEGVSNYIKSLGEIVDYSLAKGPQGVTIIKDKRTADTEKV